MAHGIDATVGSVEPGKLADLVLWDPAFFAIRPRLVLKGGAVAWAPIGDANASIPTPQPVFGRPMFAARAVGGARTTRSAGSRRPRWRMGVAERLALVRRLEPVGDTRAVTKANMVNNDALPEIAVDPETFVVTIDGEAIASQPATELPLAQRYSLF